MFYVVFNYIHTISYIKLLDWLEGLRIVEHRVARLE